MTKVSWLHLSDLQLGPKGSRWLQADVREEFERDLRRLHDRSGPWSMVLLSGDVTLTGSEREFELLNAALESFWGYLRSLGSDPVLLAVPGNHDRTQISQRPLESGRLMAWHDDQRVQEAFWVEQKDPLRQSLRRSFEAFSSWTARWRSEHALPPGFVLREGALPGDFAGELAAGEGYVEVVGLNSAFLPLSKGSLALDPRQISGEPSASKLGSGSRADLTLLLTHHPLSWLHPAAQARLLGWLKSERGPVIHLCGSLDETSPSVQLSSEQLLTFQAPSLFAGTGAEGQPHGYGVASIELGGAEGELKLWLRSAVNSSAGGVILAPGGEWVFGLREAAVGGRVLFAKERPVRDVPSESRAFSGRLAASVPSPRPPPVALLRAPVASPAPPPVFAAPSAAPEAPGSAKTPASLSEAHGPAGSPVSARPAGSPVSAGVPVSPGPAGSPASLPEVRGFGNHAALEAKGPRQFATGERSIARGVSPEEAASVPSAAVHPSVRPRTTIAARRFVVRGSWSRDGSRLAIGDSEGRIDVYDGPTQDWLWGLQEHQGVIFDLAWSPDGTTLTSCSKNLVRHREAAQGKLVAADRGPPGAGCLCFVWSPDGSYVALGYGNGELKIFDATTWAPIVEYQSGGEPVRSFVWSPDGTALIARWIERPFLRAIRVRAGEPSVEVLEGHLGPVFDLALRPNSTQFASASRDGTVRVWDAASREPVAVLEGHTDAVVGVSFSYDGRLLVSKGHDDTLRLWNAETWEQVAVLYEPTSRLLHSVVAFSPTAPVLATVGLSGKGVRLWDVDIDELLQTAPNTRTVHSLSAKVVLVGEGNAGKSCLALRLAEDRFEELGSTHGMRFWPLPIERLDPRAEVPAGERREIVLWDMGGQSEYHLIHQLFLRDTAVALLLMEPRRGEAALAEIEGWNRRLHAQMGERGPLQKFLVGTKVDDDAAPADQPAIDELVGRLGFKAYLPTSARAKRGIDELRRALASAIDWAALGRVSRPELFQGVRRQLARLREERRVVLMFTELEAILRRGDPERFDPEVLRAVVKQLAMQGVVADTRLADGARALVLEVEQVERYAGSLVVLARENPRGVPAIDLSTLMSPATSLPRIRPEERLSRDKELVVLDCVIELLLEHGICFRHEGLLIFPSLFPPSAAEQAALPHAISLFYDFSGAVDNIYASLVASLAMSRRFGHPSLWADRAEFRRAGEGAAGVRKVERKSDAARGIAHLDVYFDESTSPDARDLFVGFIEEHLRAQGVEILEHLQVTCACGEPFAEKVVRKRIAEGFSDIGCPECDRRTPLTMGAREASERNPQLARELRALRTIVEEGRVTSVGETKVSLSHARKAERMGQPIRVLHLSDLHVRGDADPVTLLQPLSADLHDREEGLGVDRLDYLVISGDITDRATPAEFERAREFVSALIQDFGLTAERCVVVPGNHDLNWDEEVYAWKKRRQIDPQRLAPGTFKEVDEGYLIRDDARYPERFKNFSQHFYHPVLQQQYPLAAEQQCVPFLAPADGLQFLALNSAFEIDEYFQERSGVHAGALARGLAEAEQQVQRARQAGQLAPDAKVLKLAVWHHPVSGNEKIVHDAFLENLQKAGVRVCLHGHVHEDRASLLGHLHPTRSIHVVGAGSFGAPGPHRPESVPRLYNLIEIERDGGKARVHTRCLKKEGGAWQGWAVWPGAERGEKRTYYDIRLA